MAWILFAWPGAAAGRAESESEQSPLRGNPAQAEWLREQAQAAQEKFRLKVAIPHLVQESSPPGGVLSGSGGRGPDAQVPDALRQSAGAHAQDLLLGVLLGLIGLLALRHIAPDTTDAVLSHIMPWTAASLATDKASAQDLAEERAFAEFLVAFKAGPPAPRKIEKSISSHSASDSAANIPPAAVEIEVAPATPFFAQAPTLLLDMRKRLQAIQAETMEATRQSALSDLCDRLHKFQDFASLPELLPVWQVASAVGGLVKQLAQRATNVTPNTLRTVASGVDLLTDLCKPGLDADLATKPPIRLLAVDDDPISRHAVGLSLKKAFNQPDVAANGEAALAQASMIAYDAIFLDILMPGMDGFEVCAKMRETSLNHTTPIVFVTSQSGFDTRAKSHISGGNDFITKPFLTFEVTVKALVMALRSRLEKRDKNASSPSPKQPDPVKQLAPVKQTSQASSEVSELAASR